MALKLNIPSRKDCALSLKDQIQNVSQETVGKASLVMGSAGFTVPVWNDIRVTV